MYFLTETQKQACEAIWRSMNDRQEFPLGLSRSFLPKDEARARFEVAKTIRMLPTGYLPLLVDREIDQYGPLDAGMQFRWTERTMRAEDDHRPLLAALQPPFWGKHGS